MPILETIYRQRLIFEYLSTEAFDSTHGKGEGVTRHTFWLSFVMPEGTRFRMRLRSKGLVVQIDIDFTVTFVVCTLCTMVLKWGLCGIRELVGLIYLKTLVFIVKFPKNHESALRFQFSGIQGTPRDTTGFNIQQKNYFIAKSTCFYS
jgi:hypothetical protein